MKVEERIKELGYELPEGKTPLANYVLWRRVGNTVYLSGHGCNGSQPRWIGKVGRDYTEREGYEAAKACGLFLLATLKQAIGDLDKVKAVVTGVRPVRGCVRRQRTARQVGGGHVVAPAGDPGRDRDDRGGRVAGQARQRHVAQR